MITEADIDRILEAIEAEVNAQFEYGMLPSIEDLRVALIAKLIPKPEPVMVSTSPEEDAGWL